MSFLAPKIPDLKKAPAAPKKESAGVQAETEEQRRRLAARGPSTRTATLLGTSSQPRSSDSLSVSRLLGGGSI